MFYERFSFTIFTNIAKETMFYERFSFTIFKNILKEIMFYETLFPSPIFTFTIIKQTYGISI